VAVSSSVQLVSGAQAAGVFVCKKCSVLLRALTSMPFLKALR
jgi:hypothetical protein